MARSLKSGLFDIVLLDEAHAAVRKTRYGAAAIRIGHLYRIS